MQNIDKDKINTIKKFGFYSKGFVYALMGIIAVIVALGLGGDVKGRAGIVQFLDDLPGGKFLIVALALGLVAYSLWRFYQTIFDPGDHQGKNRLVPRLRSAYSGIFYAAIVFAFAKPFLSGSGSAGGDSKKAMLSELLNKEWGIWIIWSIAIALAINAIWHCYIGYSGKYMKKVDDNPDNKTEYDLVKRSGKFGYIARGIVFGIIAFFIANVCVAHNANAYKDTEGVFQYLLKLSYGPFLLGAVALGMLGYGIFCLLVARNSDLTKMS